MQSGADNPRSSSKEMVRRQMAAYRHETRFDKVEFVGELYKRRISFGTVFPRDFALEVVAQWDRMTSQEPALSEVAKISARKKRHVYTDLGIEFGGKAFVAKVYRHKTFPEKIKCNLYYSVANRNFSTLDFLHGEGVGVTKPLALLSLSRKGLTEYEVLITQKLGDEFVNYHDLAKEVCKKEGALRSSFLADAAAQVARLHMCRVYTEDTYKNTFATYPEGGSSFVFLDFDNVYPWRPPNLKRTAKCLSKFIQYFPGEDFGPFVEKYLATREMPEGGALLLAEIEARLERVAAKRANLREKKSGRG